LVSVKERRALHPALAPETGLLEAAERDAEVGFEAILADGSRSDTAGDLPGMVHIGGVDGGVQSVDRVVPTWAARRAALTTNRRGLFDCRKTGCL
jgi:hypothetical protein